MSIKPVERYLRIKDSCRQGLLRYLEDAFSKIPLPENPHILDIGCGTGVPTLWLAENTDGSITAIDPDKNALDWLKNKISDKKLSDRVTVLNSSFFDYMPDPECFDLIIAEGFLNVVGFEKGFRQVNGLLRKGGFFVIHDEVRDQETKTELIRECNCQLIYSRLLDENVWWDDYYRQLEAEINSPSNTNIGGLFKNDLEEIAYYRINPAAFRSVYYVVQKL